MAGADCVITDDVYRAGEGVLYNDFFIIISKPDTTSSSPVSYSMLPFNFYCFYHPKLCAYAEVKNRLRKCRLTPPQNEQQPPHGRGM